MKFALTGATGLLGGAIKDTCLTLGHSCYCISHNMVDFHNPDKIEKFIGDAEIVIHSAANTNVEQCETDPDTCYRDNTLLTEIISAAAARVGSKFVYISSTGVYGDYQKQAYTEYSQTRPTTHHHRSKLLGEQIALKERESLVIRTGWLFGGASQNKKNFVARRIEEAVRSNGVIYSNEEQQGNPTYVNDVADYILLLIKDKQRGIFNCVNSGFASRMEYVSKIIEILKLDVRVLGTPAGSFNRLAKVSNNETATNLKLKQCNYRDLPNWDSSLEKYITTELSDFTKGIIK